MTKSSRKMQRKNNPPVLIKSMEKFTQQVNNHLSHLYHRCEQIEGAFVRVMEESVLANRFLHDENNSLEFKEKKKELKEELIILQDVFALGRKVSSVLDSSGQNPPTTEEVWKTLWKVLERDNEVVDTAFVRDGEPRVLLEVTSNDGGRLGLNCGQPLKLANNIFLSASTEDLFMTKEIFIDNLATAKQLMSGLDFEGFEGKLSTLNKEAVDSLPSLEDFAVKGHPREARIFGG
jgi:hypothetical protein